METKKGKQVSLKIYADLSLLPAVTSFVENYSKASGFPDTDCMALSLATEEIFAYVNSISEPDMDIEVRCEAGGYFVKVDFLIPLPDINLSAFNLTSNISLEDESELEQLGLMLASRKTDRLQVLELPGGGIQLTLLKEKTYPEYDKKESISISEFDTFTIRRPDSEELKLFIMMVSQKYEDILMPVNFRYPGKVLDMFSWGSYDALIIAGPSGQIGGGILWQWSGPKTVEFFGPYIVVNSCKGDANQELLDSFIGKLGKSRAVALINRLPTEELPREQFEPLGVLNIFRKEKGYETLPTYFRQMQEDTGSSVWIHPDLEDYLRQKYDSLVLPRDIRLIRDFGEIQRPDSVLSADIDRTVGCATLKPIRWGQDADSNLRDHIALFKEEGINTVFFEMDLSMAWEVFFAEALMKQDFSPKVVIPYGGQGDLLIFQWEGKDQ